MVEADGIPPTASTASTGFGIRYIENWAYALSGEIAVGTKITLLEFTTGSGFIVASMQFSIGEDTTDNIVFETLFNDQVVSGVLVENQYSLQPANAIKLVVPPFTIIKVTGVNHSGAPTARKGYAIFTGRVHGVE